MASVETVLQQVKRRGERVIQWPGVRPVLEGAVCFGGCGLLSGMSLWGRMQPVSLGVIVHLRGWRCCAAAAGSAAGCLLLWGRAGAQGLCWAVGGIALALLNTTGQPSGMLILECSGLAIGTGMLFGLSGWPLAGQALVAGLSAGALIPRRTPRQGQLGAAQVQLEGIARSLTRLQRQLLDWTSPVPDVPELARELRRNTCQSCPNRGNCLEQEGLNGALITGEGRFLCRKSSLVEPELRRTRQMLKRMQRFRARQEEYRQALVQQYGFLADALGELAERLSPTGQMRSGFRVQVSSRSRSAHLSDGDRVAAFPAPGGKFYVLLCDGMGTGMRAAHESRSCVELITQMLQSGLSPAAAMGSLNSQLTLTDRGGAVTVDLAEIHPDTGRVFLYKWGAQASWVLRQRRWIRIGSPGPPPGLSIGKGKESVSRVHLLRGDSLLLLSDGVSTNPIKDWAKIHRDNPPGELASQILRSCPDGTDDATAVVIRMIPKRQSGKQNHAPT